MSTGVKSKTILVIDDEQDICDALEMALGMEGYCVRAVQDREAALKVMTEHVPELILLDYRIPGLKPDEFVKQLRLQRNGIPIVLMTAGKDPHETARELGLHFYLSKPFELDVMLDVVRKCTLQEEI